MIALARAPQRGRGRPFAGPWLHATGPDGPRVPPGPAKRLGTLYVDLVLWVRFRKSGSAGRAGARRSGVDASVTTPRSKSGPSHSRFRVKTRTGRRSFSAPVFRGGDRRERKGRVIPEPQARPSPARDSPHRNGMKFGSTFSSSIHRMLFCPWKSSYTKSGTLAAFPARPPYNYK